MSVQSDLNLINNYKEDIYNSIKNKGVDIPADTPLSEYSSKVDAISGGGGSGYTYNKFSGTVHNLSDCASYLEALIQNNVLPDYDLYNGENQYVLMPYTGTKYKKMQNLYIKPLFECSRCNF